MSTSLRLLAAAGFALAASASHAQTGERPAYPAGQDTVARSTAVGASAAGTGANAAAATAHDGRGMRPSAAGMAAPGEPMRMASRGWSASADASAGSNHQGRPIIPGL